MLRNHAVPVRFHAVPILPQSVRFLVSSRPGAQKPCGSCAVPRGSIGGATQETAVPCSETMWFLCGSTWFHWRCNTRKCYAVLRNQAVPVRFHAVPIVPQSVRFLVSSGPGAQKPCGSCAVPRGSIGGVTQETAILCGHRQKDMSLPLNKLFE